MTTKVTLLAGKYTFSYSLALVHAPSGCGGWLEGPGSAPPYGRVPLRVQGAARRCLGRAVTAWRGRSLSCPVTCQWPVGDVRQDGLVHPSLRRAPPVLSGVLGSMARPEELAAGRSVPAVVSVRVLCAAAGLFGRPCRGALACGRPGGGDEGGEAGSGGRCPSGEHPGPLVRTHLPPAFRGPAYGAPGRRFGLP